jgi:DNA polymerase (family 10)
VSGFSLTPTPLPSNAEIADRLLELSALLDLAGANTYAVRAYRRAAEVVRTTPAPVAELVRAGRARELRGIGPSIAARLEEVVDTGEIAELRELSADVRPELVALGRLVGIGTKRVLEIGRALGISTAAEFRAAAAAGELSSVPGVGPATEAKIVAALASEARPQRGLTLNRARPLVGAIAETLGGTVAGDVRRWCELSFELAVVCKARRPGPVLDAFERLPAIVVVAERGQRRSVGVTVEGVPVTLVVAEPGRFGTELLRATGPAAYVASLEPLPDAPEEEAVYAALGRPWLPPEVRDRPPHGRPPPLVELADIRGELHCHTTWSDGRASVVEMGEAAKALGYEYLAICDHTPNVRVVPGLTRDDLRRQGKEIAEANERLAPFRILGGVECDIRADGSLDVDDDTLAELDWVQLSLHAGQRRSGADLMRMVAEAMRNPHVSALSHPKGRILNHRPENALDLDAIFEVAVETGVALEVNGLPDRLDLSGDHVREALAAGVSIVLNSDAHSTQGLANMELAVHTARRGTCGPESVVNTRPLERLLGDLLR